MSIHNPQYFLRDKTKNPDYICQKLVVYEFNGKERELTALIMGEYGHPISPIKCSGCGDELCFVTIVTGVLWFEERDNGDYYQVILKGEELQLALEDGGDAFTPSTSAPWSPDCTCHSKPAPQEEEDPLVYYPRHN